MKGVSFWSKVVFIMGKGVDIRGEHPRRKLC